MAAAAGADAQAQQDLDDLKNCMDICGITAAAKINGITVREEIVSLEQFSTFQPDEVKEIFAEISPSRHHLGVPAKK